MDSDNFLSKCFENFYKMKDFKNLASKIKQFEYKTSEKVLASLKNDESIINWIESEKELQEALKYEENKDETMSIKDILDIIQKRGKNIKEKIKMLSNILGFSEKEISFIWKNDDLIIYVKESKSLVVVVKGQNEHMFKKS